MPRSKFDQPAYRYHMSGQAVVTLTTAGKQKNYYLGEHDSPQSKAKYFALIAEYLVSGKNLPGDTETH